MHYFMRYSKVKHWSVCPLQFPLCRGRAAAAGAWSWEDWTIRVRVLCPGYWIMEILLLGQYQPSDDWPSTRSTWARLIGWLFSNNNAAVSIFTLRRLHYNSSCSALARLFVAGWPHENKKNQWGSIIIANTKLSCFLFAKLLNIDI